MKFINKKKIVCADIFPPNTNSGEPWDNSTTHGWQLCLVTGYSDSGYPYTIVIDLGSEELCYLMAEQLGLTEI